MSLPNKTQDLNRFKKIITADTKRVAIPYTPQHYQRSIHISKARFRVLNMGRRAGKTETALNELIKEAVKKPGLYWYVSPSYKQSKSIAWSRLKFLLKGDEEWKFNEQELSAFQPIFNTRIELKGADNEDSLRGVGICGCILDECAMMKENVWPEIIRPMLSDKQGWAMFISTPKGQNWFFDLFNKHKTDDNWKSWHYPTSVNMYIQPEEIRQAQKDMSERLFRQEFMAEFLTEDTGVFKKISQCIVGTLKEPVLGRFYVLGIDLAKSEDFTALTVIDTSTREVVAFERFQQILWQEQKLKIQALAGRYNNALCVIDSTGVGDPIVEDLVQAGLSIYYQDDKPGFKFTNESKTKLIEQLAVAIEQRQITFPMIPELIHELKQYEYQITNEGRIKYSAPEGKHDDCVISLALAVWGIRSYLYSAIALTKAVEADVVDRQGQGELVTTQYEQGFVTSGY